MVNQVLYLHWKAVRKELIPLTIAAFSLPLVAIQGSAWPGDTGIPSAFYASYILDQVSAWLPFFPVLAGVTGVTLALGGWSWDHETKHVYALSLPVSRAQYVLHKLGAGATLALVPTLAFLAGAGIASFAVHLPEGLHTYPMALGARFFLSSLVAYALFFALAAGTIRTAVTVLSTVVGVLVFGDVAVHFVGTVMHNPALQNASFAGWALDHLFAWPSPFRVFSGNWSLIDV